MDFAVPAVCLLTLAGIIIRPFGTAEWIFALFGALVLVVFGLLPVSAAINGVRSGTDVYLFLIGMMLLAEIARREGLFDRLAVFAARSARGSPRRLFALIYVVGTIVTIFLSNDATAVVLTPAVAAVARAAGARNPVPYLLICAFVANAASFVLPISNPANLVVFGSQMPALWEWLSRFTLPSLAAIAATYVVLRWTQRSALAGVLHHAVEARPLRRGGKVAATGVIAAAVVLVGASASGADLGLPTALVGFATLAAVTIGERTSPWPALAGVSWSTLVLVAGLFVIVEALARIGLEATLAAGLDHVGSSLGVLAAPVVGLAVGAATNLTNNLPLGLVAGGVLSAADVPARTVDAVLIGIDLGPNMSVTGSLATILWLQALKREGIDFGAWRFLKLGLLVTLPSLLLALLLIR